MKTFSLLSFQLLIIYNLAAQKFYSGYDDTILYNTKQAYNFAEYNGPAPLFVQIWHPVKRQPKTESLTFGQLRNEHLPGNLNAIYRELESLSDSSFLDYNLLYTIDTDDEIGYDGHSHADLLEETKLIPTRSYRSKQSETGKFPVIIYHHGAQGISDENYLMAEYFASRGYVFISANFHLPYAGRTYGSIPWGSSYFDTTAIATLTNFAAKLAGDQHVYAIGHSWGAQVLWHYLKDNQQIDGFLSLETSLEFETDTAKVMDLWPELYQTLETGKGRYNMPVLLMAATETDQTFPWFRGCSRVQYYCSPKTAFHHESYTSAFFSRYFMREHLPQPDEAELERQHGLYNELLEISFRFLQSNRRKSTAKFENFKQDFFISQVRN